MSPGNNVPSLPSARLPRCASVKNPWTDRHTGLRSHTAPPTPHPRRKT